jgi:hypothetical protein
MKTCWVSVRKRPHAISIYISEPQNHMATLEKDTDGL